MGLIENIRSGLGNLVGSAFADGVAEYRTMTSTTNTVPRTYTEWKPIANARVIVGEYTVDHDPVTGMWAALETGELRVPYMTKLDLYARQTQIRWKENNDNTWVVFDIAKRLNHNAGSITGYVLESRSPLTNNRRKGSL
jgi:hypothetical protein